MISKELVGTRERLEQIKNKLSGSAVYSVLHVSNLDRCLEEFDEITKKMQGRFLYFCSQDGNAQLFVLLVDFHRAMQLGCSSYIDAHFALLSSGAKQKIGTIGNDIYWICDMEVSGTDADSVFLKECIATIRDIYPEYHLIICNDKDHNMLSQEDALYQHIFDEITVWHYTSKIDLKNIFYPTEEEPFVYLAIPEHADYRKIFAEEEIEPVRIAVEHYQANKLHPFVFEKVEFSQSYVSVLKITYEQLLNYQRYINIYNCKEHLEYFLWEAENRKTTKMLVLYTIDDPVSVQDTIWNPSLEQMLQHRQGEWKLIADVVLMYPVVIEDISRLLNRKTAYDSDMNAYLNDLNIRLQCETGVPYGHDGEDMMARFKHRIDRYYLDAVQCRITEEIIMDILDKENVVIGSDIYTQIIVSVDKESNIGVLYVISLSCPFLLSHLLDNVVRNQLLVVDSENHIVGNLYEYMLNRWSIRLSGTPKSYVTIPMEKSAVNDQQLASLLMSETMYEEGEEFGQLIDKDIVKIVSEPYGMAQYDIAYVGVNLNTFIQFFPSYRGSKQYRLFWNSVTAFYIELVLFEEAAVTRFNKNLVDLMAFANKDAPEIFLEKNRKYTNEYLATVEFWNVQLNYPSSQKSIQMIRDAFNEKALLSRMERYQDQVKNIFEINKELVDREAEKQEKDSNDTMNLILFILTIVSTVSAIYQIVDYAVDYRYQTTVKNSYSVIANVIAMIFIIVVFLVKRKKRNHADKKW